MQSLVGAPHLCQSLLKSPGRVRFTEAHKEFMKDKIREGTTRSLALYKLVNSEFDLSGAESISKARVQNFLHNFKFDHPLFNTILVHRKARLIIPWKQ